MNSKPSIMKTLYFGVIGSRDYIKIKGEKRPFWEFLDSSPDGWLTSLTYRRKDLPNDGLPMIYDCGAWSYKDEEIPPVNSEQVAASYRDHAHDGAMVIAPDHMLIEGTDIDFRRRWNLEQAKQFLGDCPVNLTPMACVHGMDLDERVAHALELLGMGYHHIAIGGLAARASQKRKVVEWVREIRSAVPDVWLHVLGLSSPDYMRTWCRLGIQSADGSSHFKQAFTGGAFFTVDGDKLTKHQAARTRDGETVGSDMPECDCKACSLLRADGVDTRSYGSNEHNMGRAAHNLNMLMIAQKAAMRERVVLVACCGKKKKGSWTAGEIYQSELFLKSKAWAEKNGDRWGILSAKYGLIWPDQVIEDYDVTLNEMPSSDRKVWGERVRCQLEPIRGEKLIVLAGNKYCEWTNGFDVERPMEGLGIGQQLQWLMLDKKSENDYQQLELGL